MALLQQALIGPGRAFDGVPVKVTGYVRQDPDSRIAKGKVLVQYTNDEEDDEGNQLVCPQQAIYKLWFEENMISQHTWPAIGDQLAVPNAKAKLRRSQECASNTSLSALPLVSASPMESLTSVVVYSSLASPQPQVSTASVRSQNLASAISYPSVATQMQAVPTAPGIAFVSSGTLLRSPYPLSSQVNGVMYETKTALVNDFNRPSATLLSTSPDELY